MKWLITSFLFTCAGFVSAQVDLQVGYNFSSRIENHDKNYSNNLTTEATYKKIVITAAFGQENWHHKNTSLSIPDSVLYSKSKANKLEFYCGYKAPLIKERLEISFLYGFRHYFRNEVEKNLSFFKYGNRLSISDGVILSKLNRKEILNHYPSYEINETYAYISKMRFAHILKINVSYTFKNVGLHLFYLPNLIHFKYETPLEPKKHGSNYLLFHDVGIGLSYTFSSKSKNQE